MHLTKNELEKIAKLAKNLAITAGNRLLEIQSTVKVVKQKDRQDISTTADLASEDIIISGIKNTFPDHRIYSEEHGDNNNFSAYQWIIDPLDGTKEFIRGIPEFNVSIAVEYENKLIVSVVYRPSDHTIYSAYLGNGAYLDNERIVVSNTKHLEDSFVYCYLPSAFRNPERYTDAWNKIGEIGKRVYRLRSFADENTMLCWLAQGGHEAYINLSNPPKWHDIAPGLLIAQEAGAYIPNQTVSQIRQGTCNSIIIANHATICQEIKQIIDEE